MWDGGRSRGEGFLVVPIVHAQAMRRRRRVSFKITAKRVTDCINRSIFY